MGVGRSWLGGGSTEAARDAKEEKKASRFFVDSFLTGAVGAAGRAFDEEASAN